MKSKSLMFLAMAAVFFFAACQQEEVQPVHEREDVLVDDSTPTKNDAGARLVPVIGIRVSAENGDVCNNSWKFSAIGTGNYCLADKPMAIKWYIRYHNSDGTITESVKWQYNTCIENGKVYVQTAWLATPSMGDRRTVSFKARFYYGGPSAAPYAWRYTGVEAESGTASERHQQCGL